MSTLFTRRLSLCQTLTFISLLVSSVRLSTQQSSSWLSEWGPSGGPPVGRPLRARRQLSYRNEWASWTGWSVCSRSCGGGASVRTRTCITRNPVGGPCPGDPRQYKICNTKECAVGSEDFREMQCAAFNGRPHMAGSSYTWTTFHGGSNPCELSCLALGQNFYYNFGRVLDGTACGKEPGAVCVNGRCLKPGCDLILGSEQQEDACMVCGGQNTTCLHHRSVYQNNGQEAAGPFGYNEVAMIPAGATHIRVTDNSRNYLALQNGQSQFVINGNWKISVPGEYSVAGTKLLYRRSADTWESFEVPGPTLEDLHVMVLATDRNPGIEYEYWLPPESYALYHGRRSPLRQPHHTASYIPWAPPTTTSTRPPPVTTHPYWVLPGGWPVKPHQEPHQQPHLQPHQQPHLQPYQQPHLQPHQQPHLQPHQQPHLQPHQQPHLQPHQQPHLQPHQQPYLQPHQQPHLQPHQQPHLQPPRQPRLERDESRRNQLPQSSRGGHCGKCRQVRGRGERQRQYCQKDFVFRVKVLTKLHRGEETRYDVQIIHTYRNRFRLEHREFLWVPNVCDCPNLEEGRQYVLMVRRHINYEHTLDRILLEEDSYVVPYKPREDSLLRHLEGRCSNRGSGPSARHRSLG
ncbi:ADAMTS-like protein 5 isoform X2 [Osmerus mordax]|uniref:ADAMTS-like protein 5 isoform X2 n=1 Tax=Osmerus mordax TaxID=8014 RepID=UPI00350F98EA